MFKIGDKVKAITMGAPWDGHIGTISAVGESSGSTYNVYTVHYPSGPIREVYFLQGQLRLVKGKETKTLYTRLSFDLYLKEGHV